MRAGSAHSSAAAPHGLFQERIARRAVGCTAWGNGTRAPGWGSALRNGKLSLLQNEVKRPSDPGASPTARPAAAARAARSLDRWMRNFANISRPGRRSVPQRRGSRSHSDGPVPSPVPEPLPHAAPAAALRRSPPGTRRSAAPLRSGMPPLLPARRSGVRGATPGAENGQNPRSLFPAAALRARTARAARWAELRDSQPRQLGRAEPRGRSEGRGRPGGTRGAGGERRPREESRSAAQRTAPPGDPRPRDGAAPHLSTARSLKNPPLPHPERHKGTAARGRGRPAALTAWPRRALQGARSRPGPPQGSALPARAARGPAAPRLLRASSLAVSDRSLWVCSRLAAEVRAPAAQPRSRRSDAAMGP